MDTDAIRAAARQLRSEANKRDAEASRVSRLDSEIADAAYAAEIMPQDVTDPNRLNEKARGFRRLGEALIARGLHQYVDDMPESDGPTKLFQVFVKGLAKLICAKDSTPNRIASYLRTIEEFPSMEQVILCQWIWNDLVPVLRIIETNTKFGASRRDESLSDIQPELTRSEMAALRTAIRQAGGKTASTRRISTVSDLQMGRAKMLKRLRQLEAKGEYSGFTRKPRKRRAP